MHGSNGSRREFFFLESLEGRVHLADAWGAFPRLIDQELLVKNHAALNGAGYSVAILDTGIDYRHPALGGGFGPGRKVVAGYDFVSNDADPMDQDGHGTGVAGIIGASPFTYGGYKYQGIAPSANLIALRTEGGSLSGLEKRIESALQWVIANRTRYNIVAVNLSTGDGHYASEVTLQPYGDELATLAAAGVFIAASSGNDGVTSPYGVEYPAAHPNVYAIGSINLQDAISTFTERGANMDLLAPGENVPTTYYDPGTRQHIYLAATGTSFACPFAAGAAVLLKQINPSLTPAQIIAILKDSGASNYDGDNETGAVTKLTYKRLNLDAAAALAYATVDDDSEDNDFLNAATRLSFGGGNSVSLDGRKLIAGDDDYYQFTLSTESQVEMGLAATGAQLPQAQLIDSAGAWIANLGSSSSRRLAAGTYLVRAVAGSVSLDGEYSLQITRVPDDIYESNDSLATATPLALSGGHATLSGLVLSGGDADYYSFTIAGSTDVTLDISYAGPSALPAVQLLDSAGRLISAVAEDGLTRRLTRGTYYISVASAQSLAGTYGLSLRAMSLLPGTDGTDHDLAYDRAGTLHVAWYDSLARDLKYATRSASGVWSDVETIDADAGAGQHVSLALDSNGRPAVAYYDATSADLKYASFDGANWTLVRVDATNITGQRPSLAFDSSGRPGISYYYKTSGDLKFARFDGARWVLQTVDAEGDTGRYSSLVYNKAAGRWAVAYESVTGGLYRYGEYDLAKWTLGTVDDTKTGGGHVSLAIDRLRRPAFSYYDAYYADLKFAHFSGTAWKIETVASTGSVGTYSSLSFASDGKADIVYYNRSANGVFLAHGDVGSWSIKQLASGGGIRANVATDIFGHRTISWEDVTGTGLHFEG